MTFRRSSRTVPSETTVADLRSLHLLRKASCCSGRCVAFAFVILCAAGSWGSPKSSVADMASPVGRWTLIDDQTNSPRAVVEITQIDGELQGRVVQAFLRPGEEPNALCVKCEGERKDQLMLGMIILWGLKQDGTVWEGGHILDPTSGRTYKATLKLADGGTKLLVRGYIGFSFLGRTQTWTRRPPSAQDKSALSP